MKMKWTTCLIFLCQSSLASASESVTGTINYLQRIALPENAVVNVELQDVSKADAPAEIISKQEIKEPGQVPISFELPYNPENILPSNRYSVSARITVEGRLLFINDQNYPVLTYGNPQSVEMILKMVSPQQESSHGVSTLENTYWKLIELDGKPVPAPIGTREAHLRLLADTQSAAGSDGCNMFRGNYKLEEQKISFKGFATTLMACPEGTYSELLKVLDSRKIWKIQGEELELIEGGIVVAKFKAVYL